MKSVRLLFAFTFLALPAHAQYGGGTGEPNDPYLIYTAEQLVSIGSDPNLLDKHFVLVNDINLDPNLPGGRIFDRAVIAPGTVRTSDYEARTPVGAEGEEKRDTRIKKTREGYRLDHTCECAAVPLCSIPSC